MADNKNLGKVAITNGGTYSASTTYAPLTLVRYNGASWLSKAQTKGNAPSESSTYWQLISKDGKDGQDGNQVAVVNNLTSESTTAALSAAQGKALNAKIGAKVVITDDDTTPPSDHSVLWVHG